jgi:hypothetical protein
MSRMRQYRAQAAVFASTSGLLALVVAGCGRT